MPLLPIFMFVGACAQFVDGTLGMGFGITSATLLSLMGYSAVAASAGTHAAKVGTNLVSGLAHWRAGNVDWRVLIALAGPGAVAAFMGAVVLTNVDTSGARVWMAVVLMFLGVGIVARFGYQRSLIPQVNARTRHLWPIGLVGGFVDATGGGGWGPVATPSLMTVTKHRPNRVVGTVNSAEFLVAVAASMGFIVGATESPVPWQAVVGLILGGVLTAPIAARYAGRAPAAPLGVLMGCMVIISNVAILFKALGVPGLMGGLFAAGVAAFGLTVAVRRWQDLRREKELAAADKAAKAQKKARRQAAAQSRAMTPEPATDPLD